MSRVLDKNEFYLANYASDSNVEIFKNFAEAKEESVNEVHMAKLNMNRVWLENNTMWYYEDKSDLYQTSPIEVKDDKLLRTYEEIENDILEKSTEISKAQNELKLLKLELLESESITLTNKAIDEIIENKNDYEWNIVYLEGNYNRICLVGMKPYVKNIVYPFGYSNERDAIAWLNGNYSSIVKL